MAQSIAEPRGWIERSEEDGISSKISLRIIPLILIAYILAFLDRIHVGYVQLQMKTDPGFSDAVYGFSAGLFFGSMSKHGS
jgi:hypothetical protein